MKAELVFKIRFDISDDSFAEMVAWQLPEPLRGSSHVFKYRLAFIEDEVCVLRYDNEAVARSKWDAPEIDGNVFIPGAVDLKPGDLVKVKIVEAEEYDLVGERV